MNISEIKEAVEAIKNYHYSTDIYRQGVFKLLSLASLVIECSEVMPEKINCCKCSVCNMTECPTWVHNSTIDDCVLALTKKMFGLEKCIKTWGETAISYEFDTVEEKNRNLANAIRNHMIGGK